MRASKAYSRLAWLIPAAGLLACQTQEQQTQAATSQPAAAAEQPAPVTVMLAAKNNSGITGTATLTPRGDSTSVQVSLKGVTSGLSYPTHIHAGHCDQPGAVVQPLTSVVAGMDSTGTSTTTVATSMLDSAKAQQGSLLVQSHLPDGTPAACGEIGGGM